MNIYRNYTTTTMKERTVRILGNLGTLCFLMMPYIYENEAMFLTAAILGNVLLLPQVIKHKQYNLVFLNVVGGTRYIYLIFKLYLL